MAEALSLKRLLGGMIFASRHPLTIASLRRTLAEVAELEGGATLAFRSVKEADIAEALRELQADCERAACGFHLVESAEGYRFQSDAECGPWVRQVLDAGKPVRLSRPALETLAIVAYRQPVTRAAIEAVRGVTVDHVLHLLLEMQLIRIVGRSDLPGRPLLYGTTNAFLEHFGLRSIRDLPGIEELARRDAAHHRPASETVAGPPASGGTAPGGPGAAGEEARGDEPGGTAGAD